MQTKTLNTGVNIVNDKYISKTNNCTEEKLTDTIIDSFNEQISLSNQFKQKIENMIGFMEFAYPNDKTKIQETMASFFEASRKLSGDYMKKILDLHIVLKPAETNRNEYNHFPKTGNIIENNKWTQDWIKQIDFFKNDFEILSLADSNLDAFYFYGN